MSKELYGILKNAVEDRRELFDTEEIGKLAGIYEGELPSEYAQYFPKNSPVHNLNVIRLAWDDLATSVGRFPEVFAPPLDLTNAESKRTGLLERIASSYIRESYPSGSKFLFSLAWWLVGTGHAVIVLVPDVENKRPRFEIRDPRFAFPSAKRKVGNDIVELKDILFSYDIPYSEAESLGLAKPVKKFSRGRGSSPRGMVKVIEYIDDKDWMLVSEFGLTKKSEHGLGKVPASYITTFAPNKSGLSQFQDQITLMVAMSRILSQKIAYVDKLIYPIIWVKGHEEMIKIGPQMINKLSPQGQMGQIAPPTQLQVDRDLATIERFSRRLNRNPEVRQGEVDGKGAYVGSKTLDTLDDSVDRVVGRFWDDYRDKLASMVSLAFQMDELYWPNEEKSIYGVAKGNRWIDSYTPSEDIDGKHFVQLSYSIAQGGGYEGFLRTTQAFQSGLKTKREAIESEPGVMDADIRIRALELEQMDNAGNAAFLAAANANQLDMDLWAKLRRQMERKGTPLHEAIRKYSKELQAQATAAAGSEDVTALTTPPPEQAPQGEQLAGLPPQALA